MSGAATQQAVAATPTRVQFVRYFAVPPGNNRPGIAVVFGDWPARTLKHRGYTDERQLYLRVATVAEHEQIAAAHRHQAWYYPSLDLLFADESNALPSDDYAVLVRCLTAAWDRHQQRAA